MSSLCTTTYTYDNLNNLLTIEDPRGITYLTNEYDGNGRVIRQTMADQGTYLFDWNDTGALLTSTSQDFIIIEFDSIGFKEVIPFWNCSQCSEGYPPVISSVDVTDPRGFVRHVTFDSMGRIATDTRAVNQPEQQTVSYQWNADNSLKTVVDPLGHQSTYTYDVNLNTTEVVSLAESSSPATAFFSYEPTFSQLTAVTNPLGHTTHMTVDGKGNTTHVTDPLGNGAALSFNGDGTVATATDGVGNTTLLEYDGGDLVSVTDPLGNVYTRFTDGAGRAVSSTDAMGNTTKTEYSPFNLITATTDAQGNRTLFVYDGNGNLTSLTDALNHATSWSYDNMDRVQTRLDPLNRSESYTYDLNGNLLSHVDRKGQTSLFSYDALNRLTLAGYNAQSNGGKTTYESTISYAYDAGNRMTQAVDSAGGTITDDYDGFGRLIHETTAQGSIAYGYDLAGRRTSMTVTGQPQVGYTFDDADRLTQITQGASTNPFFQRISVTTTVRCR